MTPLETRTFMDGFRVALVSVHCDPRSKRLCFAARLYDGGRQIQEARSRPQLNPPAEAYAELRKLLVAVAAEPHICVATGGGWQGVLAQTLAERSGAYRILDLTRSVRAIEKQSGPLGLPARVAVEGMDPDGDEARLWALLNRAGELGLDWPGLLGFAEASRPQVSFEGYAFDAGSLSKLPESPGVYLMRDRERRLLYVGKASNLRGRLGSYFSGEADSEKLRAIRDRIHCFEFETVGSELEALLREDQLIASAQPDINVQRQVREGQSRYSALVDTVAVMAGAQGRDHASVFLFGSATTALQVTLNLKKPQMSTLIAALAYACAERRGFRSGKAVVDWGARGREICTRYFARHRNAMQWISIRPDADCAQAIVRAARQLRDAPPDGGAFRLDA